MNTGPGEAVAMPLGRLAVLIQVLKDAGLTVAMANGGFDLLHVGHVRYLTGAAKTADVLVVALNSDSSLRQLKGPGRPILSQGERVSLVSAVEGVDYVTVFDEQTVDHVLLALKPHIHCKGSDYTPETVPERHTVHGYGGRIAIVGGRKARSSSLVIQEREHPPQG